MDCSLPGSSAMGIFQARILEWVAIYFTGRWILYLWASGEAQTGFTCHVPQPGKDKLRHRGTLPTVAAEPSRQAPAGAGGAGGGLVHSSEHTSWALRYHLKRVVRNLPVRGHQNCWEVRGWLMPGCCSRIRLPGGRRKSTKYKGLGPAIPHHQHREPMTVTDSTLEGRRRRPPLREPRHAN